MNLILKRLRLLTPRPRWDVLLKQYGYQSETGEDHDTSKTLPRNHPSAWTRHDQCQNSVHIAYRIYKDIIVFVYCVFARPAYLTRFDHSMCVSSRALCACAHVYPCACGACLPARCYDAPPSELTLKQEPCSPQPSNVSATEMPSRVAGIKESSAGRYGSSKWERNSSFVRVMLSNRYCLFFRMLLC